VWGSGLLEFGLQLSVYCVQGGRCRSGSPIAGYSAIQRLFEPPPCLRCGRAQLIAKKPVFRVSKHADLHITDPSGQILCQFSYSLVVGMICTRCNTQFSKGRPIKNPPIKGGKRKNRRCYKRLSSANETVPSVPTTK
jgi:hypothetical protein